MQENITLRYTPKPNDRVQLVYSVFWSAPYIRFCFPVFCLTTFFGGLFLLIFVNGVKWEVLMQHRVPCAILPTERAQDAK